MEPLRFPGERSSHFGQMVKTIFVLCSVAMLVALTACGGEVVTPEPTVEPSPTATITPAPTSASRITATPPFTPPPPTATSTLTPTPIVHVVQSGDVLQNIAFQYGVSVQAIQAANGIENPQFLQIGQELIIPVGDEEASAASSLLLPTATPLAFDVQGVGFYHTPVGSLWCLGEVANTTDAILKNVQIHVALFDAAGELLAEADAFAAADLISPGKRSPFGILFTNPPEGWVNSQVTVVGGEAAGALADAYVPITVTEAEGRSSDLQFQVSGVVQNTSAEQADSDVLVIVTAYDAQGLVTGFRQGMVEFDGTLAPGATAPFTVRLTIHGGVPTDEVPFSVIALGRVPSE